MLPLPRKGLVWIEGLLVVADPTGNGSAWNAWSYLDVVPEPNPSAFLGVASLALIGGRRYGRAKPALKSER